MCQLLAINSTEAADVSESFSSFTRRGAPTNPHGWGMSYYDECRKLQTFLEPLCANACPVAQRLCLEKTVKTTNMLAHIRYATQGEVCLQNVHPFTREIWGIHLCFAHNGEVPKYYGSRETTFENTRYQPVGNTDSEAFFCDLLNFLDGKFSGAPSKSALYKAVHGFCTQLASEHDYLILNFLLSFGENVVLAYSWPGKRPGGAVWNGLWYAVRQHQFAGNTLGAAAIVSTKPLTEGCDTYKWRELQQNELILFERGVPYSFPCSEPVKNVQHLRGTIESTELTVHTQNTSQIMLGSPFKSDLAAMVTVQKETLFCIDEATNQTPSPLSASMILASSLMPRSKLVPTE